MRIPRRKAKMSEDAQRKVLGAFAKAVGEAETQKELNDAWDEKMSPFRKQMSKELLTIAARLFDAKSVIIARARGHAKRPD